MLTCFVLYHSFFGLSVYYSDLQTELSWAEWESVIVGECILPRICIRWLIWFVCIICTILNCVFVVGLWAAGWLGSSHNLKTKGWCCRCGGSRAANESGLRLLSLFTVSLDQMYFSGLTKIKRVFAPLQRVNTNVCRWWLAFCMRNNDADLGWIWALASFIMSPLFLWVPAKIMQLVYDRHCIECDPAAKLVIDLHKPFGTAVILSACLTWVSEQPRCLWLAKINASSSNHRITEGTISPLYIVPSLLLSTVILTLSCVQCLFLASMSCMTKWIAYFSWAHLKKKRIKKKMQVIVNWGKKFR